MKKDLRPLSWIFNTALAGAFFSTVFLPFWLLSIPPKYSAWGRSFSRLYPNSAYRMLTVLRAWRILPVPQAKDARWLLAFAFYSVLSALFAALFTAAIGWRRKASR
jgi:hypothetical protein